MHSVLVLMQRELRLCILPSLAILELIVTGRTRHIFVWSGSAKSRAEKQALQSPSIGYLLPLSALYLYRLDCSGLAGPREHSLAEKELVGS